MAPFPQTTTSPSSPSSPSPEPQTPSVLPGLKRGIAVGVASSICIIAIALLAFFAVRRRNKRKAQQQQQGHSSDTKELPAWSEEKRAPIPPEKNWIPIPPSPIEADTRAIYELEASPVPELPTKIHVPGAQELDTESENDNINASDRRTITTRESVVCYEPSEPRYSDVPTLRISPPEMSPLSTASLLAISPMTVSPLEEAYLPQSPRSPRSPRSPQHWI